MKVKEAIHIIIAIIIMALTINLIDLKLNLVEFPVHIIYSALIILVSVFAKKINAFKRDIEIEHSIWKFSRWGIYRRSHLKSPVPIGILLPLGGFLLTRGYIRFLTFLQFDGKATKTKVVKKFGRDRRDTEMEFDFAMISFWGLCATLFLSLIANYLSNIELARLALYYSIWNLVPFSQLDGTKILFGSGPLKAGNIFLPPLLFTGSLIITIIVSLVVLL